MTPKVFLIVVLWFNSSSPTINNHPMPDWESCFKALAAVKIEVSHGNESEAMAAAYCAPTENRWRS